MSQPQIFQIFTAYLQLILVCSLIIYEYTTSQEWLIMHRYRYCSNSEASQETREMSMQILQHEKLESVVEMTALVSFTIHLVEKKSKHPGGQKT